LLISHLMSFRERVGVFGLRVLLFSAVNRISVTYDRLDLAERRNHPQSDAASASRPRVFNSPLAFKSSACTAESPFTLGAHLNASINRPKASSCRAVDRAVLGAEIRS